MDNSEKIFEAFKQFGSISTDSRQIKENSIFFALPGDNFNGNKFAADALQRGAAMAVVDDAGCVKGDDYILVDDSLEALQKLAADYRKSLSATILGITGSNGKTTTKELISAVLATEKNTVFTQGNFNNHIGVPLSVLSLKTDTEVGVIEMGANHIGEIENLCKIANPDVGLITNIGKAHLEGFGSYEGVIKAKNELYQAIKDNDGELLLNEDDDLLRELGSGINSFSYGAAYADVNGRIIQTNPTLVIEWVWNDKPYLIKSKLYGNYNFPNIMAAIAAGLYFNIKPANICRAIEDYKPNNNRSQQVKTNRNKLILDAYNANPVSMQNALKSFRDFNANNPVLILGDMFELGNDAAAEHKSIIDQILVFGFKDVFLLGEEFYKFKDSNDQFTFFRQTLQMKDFLLENSLEGKTILIKGSRGMKLESLVELL